MTPSEKSSKLPLLLLFFVVFIDLVGFGIIIPVLPTVAQQYGADPFVVAWLVASYSLMQFFFAPFWGRLSDSVGRRKVLLLSLFASTAGYLIWGLASTLPLLFLSRLLAGAGSGNMAVAQAYIADVTTPENRAKGMGLLGAAFGLGFVLGPAIGGAVTFLGGHHDLGLVAAGCSALAFVLAAAKLPEPPARSQAGHDRFRLDPAFYVDALTDPRLRLSLALFFVFTFAFANMEATLVLFTERVFQFGIKENSLMFTYIGLLMVLIQGGLVGRLNKRVSEKKLVLAGALFTAAGLLLIAFSRTPPVLYVALALLALGTGITNPANQSMLSKQASPGGVGGVLGVGQSLSTLGRILGPLAGGWLFLNAGLQSPYYLGCGVMLLSFAIALFLPSPAVGNGAHNSGPMKLSETEGKGSSRQHKSETNVNASDNFSKEMGKT
jgi:DHA1 family tetracycline resistance protein-like MFS transporter